jgi:hypothetical protein
MKLLDEGLDSNREGEFFSFFNELDTGEGLCSGPLFHFLMSFPQRSKNILKTSDSFFNEISTENKNYSQDLCFIF